MELLFVVGSLGALCWIGLALTPWRPWSTSERLNTEASAATLSLEDVSVLIPARNEELVIESTLKSLKTQGENLKVVLVDDQSEDRTAELARQTFSENLEIVQGSPLPDGWAGKLWALEQGRKKVSSDYILLMDADIQLRPGMLKTLKQKALEGYDFVSLMAFLNMRGFWEKLLIPAYIYFFKILYPFKLANSKSKRFASAAGGCIFLKREALEKIGGFGAIQNALIDDCSLALKIKQAGYRTWTGLTHSVVSHRAYSTLKEIWDLVARFAFTYLRYSYLKLIGCALIMVAMFIVLPICLVFANDPWIKLVILAGNLAMIGTYLPTVLYYRLNPVYALLMPLVGGMYLAMTLSSALRFSKGERSQWKGRKYSSKEAKEPSARQAS